MRQIGSLADADLAERFADHLRALGIAVTVDRVEGSCRIWVHDENRVSDAKAEFPLFLAEPEHDRYRNASKRAMVRIREDAARAKAIRTKTVNLAERWDRPVSQRSPVTFGLIVISAISAFLIGFEPNMNEERAALLRISDDGSMRAIMSGEVWRLVTPIFMHMSLMHLVFNMLCLREFGIQIEIRTGPVRYVAMVIAIAIVSNFAQFWFHNHHFGGMSGVVYGLFGYIWIKGKLEPESGYWLPAQTITMMLVWHVLCVVGVIPRVANWAHGGGLAAGIVIAACETQFRRIMRSR